MKFLFFTDSHIRGTNPRSRTDDYYSALKTKFNEIGELISKLQVDYVLHGGDWFDRPDISPSIVREFAIIIRKFNRPVYTVAGNHDIFGHNPDTLSRTMLGLLEGAEVISVIRSGKSVILEKDGKRVQLYGNSYDFDIDGENFRSYYVVDKEPGTDYCINMVHGMLLPRRFIEGIKYTLIEDIADTGADITLAGHYHTGFGIKKVDEKYFVNPGSIARISAIKSEMTRIPEVAVIELDETVDIQMIKLQTALPGEQVLNREHIEAEYDRTLKLNQFFRSVGAVRDYEQARIDINRIIEEIASSEGLEDNVRLETIRRLELARQNFSEEEVND